MFGPDNFYEYDAAKFVKREAYDALTKGWPEIAKVIETFGEEEWERGFEAGVFWAAKAVESMATERELNSPSGLDVDIHDVLAKIREVKHV
jgi:hypothetical protein